MKVLKRKGKVEKFRFGKIVKAIDNAFNSCNEEVPTKLIADIKEIFKDDENSDDEKSIDVEEIRDIVEEKLTKDAPYCVAKAFIINRYKHAEEKEIRERVRYMKEYQTNGFNAATSSASDPNANMNLKNVANMEAEVYKPTNRKTQRIMTYDSIKNLYSEKLAKQYLNDLEGHLIYTHDEASSPVIKNYTYSPSEVAHFIYNGVDCLISLKSMYDIAVEPEIRQDGDEVWSKFPQNLYVQDDKGFTKVTRLTRKSRYNDLVRVKTSYGEDLVVTANHPLIKSEDKEDRIEASESLGEKQKRLESNLSFKGLTEIDLAGCVSYDEVHENYILTHETQAPYYFAKRFVNVNRDLGYVVGFFIGDGNYDNTFDNIMFSQKDKPILEKLSNSLFNSFGIVSYIHQNENGVYTMKVCSKIVNDLFRNYFKIKDKAQNKCLPYNLLEFNDSFAKGIIEGIIDSDGNIQNNGASIGIRLSSRECIMQLTMLLKYFGYGVANTHQGGNFQNNNLIKTNYDIWGVYFTNTPNTAKFDNSFKWKAKITKEINKGLKYSNGWSLITSVDKITEGSFLNSCSFIYDITTETHTFNCNNLWVHNCEAVTLWPILEGTSSLDGTGTKPPTNLQSFCGQLINVTFLLAGQCKGAVAFGEFFNFFDYYAVKDFGEDYDLKENLYADSEYVKKRKTIGQKIEQYFQAIVYNWNQPQGNRGNQSPFTNISYYDSNYWHALFDDFTFPDGSKPLWRRIDYLQKKFMKWFNAERNKTLLTFPVETMAMLTDGKDIIDKDYKKFNAEMYAEGHSFFTYLSDNPDSLASCCRLRNQINENVFSFTNGLTGVQTGSCNVITLNLNRLTQQWFKGFIGGNETSFEDRLNIIKTKEAQDNFVEYLANVVKRMHKYHIAYKSMLYDWEKNGMFTASKAGYISMKKLYSTIGLNGINEAAEYMGLKCTYNDDYKKFCNLITTTISKLNKEEGTQKYQFNTEFVPAESLSSKNYNWDKNDGYWVPADRNLYNSYFYIASDPNTTVLDRFKLHGKEFTGNLDGGVGLHCNLEENLSYEQYMDLTDFAIKVGCSYYTYNIPQCQCDKCGHIEKHHFDKCPVCGCEEVTDWTRIIGYLRPIKKFDKERFKEAKTRIYMGGHNDPHTHNFQK